MSREIRHQGTKEGLEVQEINPKTAKKAVSGNGSITKRELAKIISSRYPELRIYVGQTHKYKEKYWQNMFDAVGIALAAKQ